MLLLIQQLLMLIIQYILNSFKKEQKEKTGIDYKKSKQLLNKDVANLRARGINPKKLAASTWYMDSKNLEKQKEASSIWGKTFGMTREPKEFSHLEQQEGSQSQSQYTQKYKSYNLSGTSGLMEIYLPFITNLFAVDEGELPRDVRIPGSSDFFKIKLFESGQEVMFWFNQTFSPSLFYQQYQYHYNLLSFAQRISVGTSAFKKVTEIALNADESSVVADIPKAWELILNLPSKEVIWRNEFLSPYDKSLLKIPTIIGTYMLTWSFNY